MNLLCNVIKSDEVKILGTKKIKINPDVSKLEIENEEVNKEIEQRLQEAKENSEQIIKNAQIEADKIIDDAKETAKQEVSSIEKQAYEKGHAQGLKNGYEDGYKDVYEEHVTKAEQKATEIVENANKILIQANKEVSNYMKEQKSNILNMSISIAEQVLREKFEDVSVMENLIENIITEYELKENFVIKVNPMYKESLEKQIQNLKESHRINSDVFVLEDESIQTGNAVIDNMNGSLIVGIDGVLEKIKEELL